MRRIETDALVKAQQDILTGLGRYPLVQKTMLRIVSQVPSPLLEEATDELLRKTDPEIGSPYLTQIPVPFGKRGAARVYRSEHKDILAPFIHLAPVGNLYIDDGSGRFHERQRIIQALSTFPVLNPTLMQNALQRTAKYFRQDLEFLVKEHIAAVWHPLYSREYLLEDITARGTRYFLAKHAERLRPFLIR